MDASISMLRTHQNHMGPVNSPFAGSGANIMHLERTIGARSVTGAGTFQDAMLQALDRVSGTQQYASRLSQEALVNPHLVDVHDLTIAMGQAEMSLDITRNILNRMVQSWRDLINTR
jgi:flagellar hook-basal body complex protein FliE